MNFFPPCWLTFDSFREYTFASWASWGKPSQCYSIVGPGTAITYYTTSDGTQWEAATLTLNTTTSVHAVHINGWVFAEETGSPECTAMASITSPARGDGALSTGDKIGIGIGVGMGVVGMATLAAGLFMMRRARRFHHPKPQKEQQRQHQQTMRESGPGWYSAPAYSGAPVEIAVEDRYVAPPSELHAS